VGFLCGDRVFYLQWVLVVGRAGFVRRAPAVFIRAGQRRCTVEVRMLSGEVRRVAVREDRIVAGSGYWSGQQALLEHVLGDRRGRSSGRGGAPA
jgi:hypothetical protein